MVLVLPFFIYGIFVLLSVSAWRMLNWAWFQPRKLENRLKQQGFRGNPYIFLHGDFKEIKSQKQAALSKPISLADNILPRVIPEFLRTLQKYGKNSYVWMGTQPWVLIMEPKMIKEIANKIDVFGRPRSNPLSKLLAEGLIAYEGQKWAKHRKLLTPAFHLEKLKLMLPAFYESASEMVSKWEDMVSEKGPVIEVDVWPHLQALSSDAISRTAFGSNFEEGKRIFELQQEQAGHIVKASRSFYLPGFRFLPTKRFSRMRQIVREVDKSVMEIINVRLKSMKEGKWNGKDLLGLLLESNSQETHMHGNKYGMSIKDVIEECKLFYFVGQETTSVLLVWTMVLLSQFQDWQSRAREEVLQIFGTSSIKPDFDKLNQLKTINMILYESLRLYPPVANIIRKTVKETKIGNLTFPAGAVLSLPIMLMHHDPEIWGDDVKDFKPERFAEGVSHATKGQLVYFPFGWGPRICIGQNFAMLEAKLAMAMILQRFSFQLSPSYSHAPRSAITVQPQHGAHMILNKL